MLVQADHCELSTGLSILGCVSGQPVHDGVIDEFALTEVHLGRGSAVCTLAVAVSDMGLSFCWNAKIANGLAA
jgi:hypothetical protein